MMISLYTLLNIDEKTPINDIKKNYKQLMLLIHPDKHNNNPMAEHLTKLVTKAYEQLTKIEDISNGDKHEDKHEDNIVFTSYPDYKSLLEDNNSLLRENNKLLRMYSELLIKYNERVIESTELRKENIRLKLERSSDSSPQEASESDSSSPEK